jgi:hypothetical protein
MKDPEPVPSEAEGMGHPQYREMEREVRKGGPPVPFEDVGKRSVCPRVFSLFHRDGFVFRKN